MTRGLGRIPPIRGTLTQARDEAGDDMSADRHTPTSGRTGHPTEGTGGKGKREGSPPGRRRPGLAPGASGWPWHPRRLATALHRETRGGLVWGVCARSRRCPAAAARPLELGDFPVSCNNYGWLSPGGLTSAGVGSPFGSPISSAALTVDSSSRLTDRGATESPLGAPGQAHSSGISTALPSWLTGRRATGSPSACLHVRREVHGLGIGAQVTLGSLRALPICAPGLILLWWLRRRWSSLGPDDAGGRRCPGWS
jgi:hypothetical protein